MCQCQCDVVSGVVDTVMSFDKPDLTEHATHVPNKLTGDISALRQYVDNKFKDVVHVPRRVRGKHADVHCVFGKFAKSCLKRPATGVVIKRPAGFDATTGGGWTVVSFLRKSGLQAGRAYKVFVGPDNRRYDSKVKAERAGYVAP